MNTRATALYPFVPSGSQYARAIEFFGELGFEREWGTDEICGLRFGAAYFLLQNVDVRVWQENQMVTYEVADLEAYWAELAALDLPGRYPGVKLKPPATFPWGREVHIINLGGVCWHVRQSAG